MTGIKRQSALEVGQKLDAAVPIKGMQTETPAFCRWFGDSKVVDVDGAPLVVYHGTNAKFSVFDPKAKKGVDNFVKDGIFFTEDEYAARRYGDNLMAAYVRIAKPVTFDTVIEALGYEESSVDLLDEYGSSSIFYDAHQDAILRIVKKGGHDGVILNDTGELFVVAFRPEQIKSATGNNGEFCTENPDITR
jgi:hypothetical protein